MIVWHYHHIIPKHMNGTDEPSNILKCNVAMHAFLHKCLWEKYGHWEDRIAWQGLTGIISHEEAVYQTVSEASKETALERVANGTNPFLDRNISKKGNDTLKTQGKCFYDPEWQAKYSRNWLGRKHSEKTKQKMSFISRKRQRNSKGHFV